MSDLLSTLTDEQRAAVEARDAEVHVQAGPGSGKTLVLAGRIVHLIASGVDPRSILALTFTRAACAEIRDRVIRALGFEVAPRIETFHGYAASVVVSPGQRVATEAEAEAALRSLFEGPMRRPPRALPGIETLREAIVSYEAEGVSPGNAMRLRLVLSRLTYANLVPTWDLVPSAVAGAVELTSRYRHVLVDEAQDTTHQEERLAIRAVVGGGAVFAVGDPRQAIFGWRWATGWKGEVTHRLTRTFRFGHGIAAMANSIAARCDGELIEGAQDVSSEAVRLDYGPSPGEFGAALHQEILGGHVIRPAGQVLILARTNRECEAIEQILGNGTARHVQRNPLDPLSSESDRFVQVWADGRAVISTIHAAKGKESDRVVLVRDLEREEKDPEERRVDYVACTRARRRLAILREARR